MITSSSSTETANCILHLFVILFLKCIWNVIRTNALNRYYYKVNLKNWIS